MDLKTFFFFLLQPLFRTTGKKIPKHTKGYLHTSWQRHLWNPLGKLDSPFLMKIIDLSLIKGRFVVITTYIVVVFFLGMTCSVLTFYVFWSFYWQVTYTGSLSGICIFLLEIHCVHAVKPVLQVFVPSCLKYTVYMQSSQFFRYLSLPAWNTLCTCSQVDSPVCDSEYEDFLSLECCECFVAAFWCSHKL